MTTSNTTPALKRFRVVVLEWLFGLSRQRAARQTQESLGISRDLC
jgi:hypothetical protein